MNKIKVIIELINSIKSLLFAVSAIAVVVLMFKFTSVVSYLPNSIGSFFGKSSEVLAEKKDQGMAILSKGTGLIDRVMGSDDEPEPKPEPEPLVSTESGIGTEADINEGFFKSAWKKIKIGGDENDHDKTN